MREYIVEFDVALYDEKTGQAVFKPKIEGELIRCRDCKSFRKDESTTYCAPMGLEMKPNDYCSYAERKDE